MRNLGKWIGPTGSDCGIVNVRDVFVSFLVKICEVIRQEVAR